MTKCKKNIKLACDLSPALDTTVSQEYLNFDSAL